MSWLSGAVRMLRELISMISVSCAAIMSMMRQWSGFIKKFATVHMRSLSERVATYYGVSMAVGRIAESIIRDENSVLPVSSLMEGEYGLEDLCISVPTLVSQKGAEQVLEIPLDEKEHEKLRQSAAELKKVLETLDL